MCWDNIQNVASKKGETNVDARCYELKDYEKESLKQLNEMAKEGYASRPELLAEHMEYLISLIQRVTGILEMERSVGAPTADLEKEIVRMKNLFIRLEEIKKSKV
jgi:hypothetical protein